MIYATFIAGEEYVKKYYLQVQREIKGKDIHILTDHPNLFPEGKTELYSRDIFSYYEKLTFLAKKVLERKQRVTFIDCDWLSGLHCGIELDDNSFYTYRLFDFDKFELRPQSMRLEGINMVREVLEKNNYTLKDEVLIGEAIMSLPYTEHSESILNDLLFLQEDWEDKFSQNIISENTKLLRYASYGVGYGEGGALAAVLQKYNIDLKEVSRKEFIHNTPM